MSADRDSLSLFVLFRKTEARQRLVEEGGTGQLLYGADALAASGWHVSNNLEPQFRVGRWLHQVAHYANRACLASGRYGGDFGSILACRSAMRRSDAVFSTMDSLGLVLIATRRYGLARVPLVYASIGLPGRIQGMSPRVQGWYRRRFMTVERILAYGWGEAEWLRNWLGPDHAARVAFVPFGVNIDYFRPSECPVPCPEGGRVLCVGSDPHRDFDCLLSLARLRPGIRFRVVTHAANQHLFSGAPENLSVAYDIPLDAYRAELAGAAMVVLPVKPNLYSGATTTLLQAMAMECPVAVTRTAAIAGGYGLQDGENCCLVEPDDLQGWLTAIDRTLSDPLFSAQIARAGAEHVRAQLGWEQYVTCLRGHIAAVVRDAAGRCR